MITIAACGRAQITVDVWFTDGRLDILHVGLNQEHGFLVFLEGSNVQAVKAQVDNCTEDGDIVQDRWSEMVVRFEDRLLGTMLCVVDDKVEAFTSNHSTWEWKR